VIRVSVRDSAPALSGGGFLYRMEGRTMTADHLNQRLHDSEMNLPVVWEHDGYTYTLAGVETRTTEYGVKLVYLIWELDGIGG
jgi:hypothetical protein